MRVQPVAANQNRRIVTGLPFVEALARRMAPAMPNSIDIGDLVQDGVLGLIDAANRFDEARGIKFETFAERRVRGAMIDALRRDAWPRGVRRQRRELDAAREALRRELGHEPALGDMGPQQVAEMRRALVAFASRKPKMVKAHLPEAVAKSAAAPHGVVLPYRQTSKRQARPPIARSPRPHRAVAAVAR